MRRFLKRLFKLGVVAGVAYAVWRWFESQQSESDLTWEARPTPYPPEPRPRETGNNPSSASATSAPAAPPAPTTTTATTPSTTTHAAWVEPTGGTCPPSHPVKAKMSSKIFHVAGGLNYERTRPDRCYRDPAAAEADGLRKSAR